MSTRNLLPPTKYSELLSGMNLIDETRRKSKNPPRNRLAPLQDTQKVLEWSAQHGLAVDNEVLLGLQKGPEATGGNPSPFTVHHN